ncbi:hypothetical protein PG985_012922 [Apiospora marii]
MRTGVFWECRESLAPEFHPAGMPFVESFNSFVYGNDELRIDCFWRFVIKLYSSADLTARRDKFPALAGIERAAADVTGDEYLAGLWKRDIEFHLCWSATHPAGERKRLGSHGPNCLASNWSWAAVEGPVTHLNLGADREIDLAEDFATWLAHVHDAEMMFSGVAPLGRLSRGVLCLHCSVILCGWLRKRDLAPEYTGKFWFDVAPIAAAVETLTSILCGEDKEELFRIKLDSLEELCEDEEVPVCLIPLVEELRRPYGSL